MAIYSLEVVIKMLALGIFLEEDSYMRDPWNVLDFLIVSISYIPASKSVSALRAVRSLRTIRTLSAFPQMSKLVQMIIETIPKMLTILFLVLITVLMFAIIAMQLFSGSFAGTCVNMITLKGKG